VTQQKTINNIYVT